MNLLLAKRFSETDKQIDWVKEGVFLIVPKVILNILNWEEIEIRAAGEKIVNIDTLKSITEYYGPGEGNEFIDRFWRVLSEMSEEEKQLYLKFVWGRQRMPSDCSNLRYKHTICLESHDEGMPQAHTCFFQIDIPRYASDEICRKRLITAITLCGEIDTDYSGDGIADEGDDTNDWNY